MAALHASHRGKTYWQCNVATQANHETIAMAFAKNRSTFPVLKRFTCEASVLHYMLRSISMHSLASYYAQIDRVTVAKSRVTDKYQPRAASAGRAAHHWRHGYVVVSAINTFSCVTAKRGYHRIHRVAETTALTALYKPLHHHNIR